MKGCFNFCSASHLYEPNWLAEFPSEVCLFSRGRGWYRITSVGYAVDSRYAGHELPLPLHIDTPIHVSVPVGQPPDVQSVAPLRHQHQVHDVLEVLVRHRQLVNYLDCHICTCWLVASINSLERRLSYGLCSNCEFRIFSVSSLTNFDQLSNIVSLASLFIIFTTQIINPRLPFKLQKILLNRLKNSI